VRFIQIACFLFKEKWASFFIVAEYCLNHWMAVSWCVLFKMIFPLLPKGLAYYYSLVGVKLVCFSN
jgi:hypothetical protein